MASVDWQKATTQKAGAMIKHNGKVERVNGNHSNTDIDKRKSHMNVYIGADDYAPMLEKVKARIREVDKAHPPKRDMGDRRITCILLEIPVPQEITAQGKAAEFLTKAHKVLEDFFGAENVGGTVGHFDEQHIYTDKDGKERLSLVHGHSVVAAYAEWTEHGELRQGINGKHCETRTRLKALNDAIDAMCRREYNISYNTAETPERKSVERLKEETKLRREADAWRKEIANLSAHVDKLKLRADDARDSYLTYDEMAREAEVRQSDAESRTEGAEKRLIAAEHRLEEVNGQYDEASEGLKQVLDQKARASEIHKISNLFREQVSYHKNMLESTRAIGSQSYEHEKQARKLRDEAVSIRVQTEQRAKEVERKEKEIEPLYQQAEQERRAAQTLRRNMEREIQTRAEKLSEQKMKSMFGDVQTDRASRLEDFCENLKLDNGMSVLDVFEEMENQLKRRRFRGR